MKVVEGKLTSGFGVRVHPVTKAPRMHKGVDISAPVGTPVYCPEAGQVVARGFSPLEGNFVRVLSGGRTFVFMHLSAFSVTQSQMVSRGQQIGAVGATGLVTGGHLHFEVHVNGIAVDPAGYVNF